jgi:NAD(P)-dependent dehydrogenase (short-subunit alcohol dehydrogenase family)
MAGKATIITGADSGIGRAVAIAFAREGADVLIAYLDEHEDAQETARHVEEAGQKAVLLAGRPVQARGLLRAHRQGRGGVRRVDVLVNNAAFQMNHETLEEIPDDEWDYTFATNITAMFHTCKAALPHMPKGGSIINTSSINSDQPVPTLAPYAATKAAIVNFTASLAQLLGPKGIRANSVAPGPVWTPLIPATMPPDKVESFGTDTPLGRPAQPAEMAPVYVMLGSDESSTCPAPASR